MFAFRTVGCDRLQHTLPRIGIFPLERVKAVLSFRFAASLLPGFLVTGFIAPACISAAQAPPQNSDVDEQKTTIRGTVVNAVTHAAIARALVHSTDNRFAILTDGDGHFEFDLPKVKTDNQDRPSSIGSIQLRTPHSLDSNQISLEARKPGFFDNQRDRSRVEAYAGVDVTIPLVPESLIKGRVTLSTADAATGVTVQIFSRQVQNGLLRWVPGVAARANSAGEFRIAELAAGSYKLFTHELRDNDPAVTVPGGQAYGYAPVFYPGAPDFASAGTIELAAGQTFEADISLTHQPYYDVKIPVANAETAGGLNATVSVQGHRGPGYTLGYNGGAGRIEGALPNGNYVVEGETYGQGSSTGSVNLKVAGAPAEGPPMTLVRNSSISVDVKEEFAETIVSDMHGTWSDGKRTFSYSGPRAYVQVMAETADDFEQRRTGTPRPPIGPNDNQLIIEDLPPGRYWIRVNSGVGYAAAVSAGATDLLHEPLTIAPGSNTPIEVKMRDDFAELDGTVGSILDAASLSTDGSGASTSFPPHIYCIPLPESAGQLQETFASSDGKIQVHVAPGDYRVLAFAKHQPNLAYRDADAMRAYETKGQVVHLGAGQKVSVQLQVLPSE